MVDVPPNKKETEQSKNRVRRAINWVNDARSFLRNYFEPTGDKYGRVLQEFHAQRKEGYDPYKDPDALVSTAKTLLEIDRSNPTSRTCITMALQADPDHEEAKKMLEELER